MGDLRDLGEGVWVAQAPLWETNALLARSGGETLLLDPGLAPEEIETLAGHAAAREADERRLPPGSALLHVFAVEPPRETTLDFEIYGLRAANSRAALADA